MKVSTKGIYGLKAMIDLAYYSSKDDIVTLKSISERENISERYLEQIFSLLRKKGLIKGRKGSQGGYTLVYNPSEITVGQILRSLEGELLLVNTEDYSNDELEKCINNAVWNKLNVSVNEIVDNITLENMLEEYRKATDQPIMYYI
ncbi:Rrf2 family transcriptional regulator [Hathewaya histolytica]|uniref:Rrf2 family protein, putative transcriptional regulator n=1 Tax=Hathewaya histolytica TaxID=1498 RepID=A0A4U9QX33_HATHI|nr:Rrf2 family transcriptional regulator [Hathewaya histolytica]VTQ83019.1 rrf2 family protein, putative transcriptional regulator [Hathewaya histolytica]